MRQNQGLPENFAPLLVENIKKGGYTHVIAGHTAFGKSLLPRVAADDELGSTVVIGTLG